MWKSIKRPIELTRGAQLFTPLVTHVPLLGGDIYQPEGLPDTVFERELEFFQLVDDTVEIASVEPEPELTHSDLVG